MAKPRVIKKIIIFQNNSGFSLIELMVYLSLIGMMTIIFTGFTVDIIKHSIKTMTINEINKSTRLLLSQVSQEIKTSKEIISVNPNTIVLVNYYGQTVVISYDAANKVVNYKDGLGSLLTISDTFTRVTDLNFKRISNDVIGIYITVEQKNPNALIYQKYQLGLSAIVASRSLIY